MTTVEYSLCYGVVENKIGIARSLSSLEYIRMFGWLLHGVMQRSAILGCVRLGENVEICDNEAT